ncbi:KfrB domain-containing protein [Verminephrobacter aporrectodeae]|uniref:KfrB domain-containing protein n=1 Tax=Verminephrobacter aporrectodeae TaxID=1110389 RepID=UPI002238B32C|nr:zeta toxin family protein [Verminephrobacter aporrectodeae]
MSGSDVGQTRGALEPPIVVMFAGPNGSGKSTVNQLILKGFPGEYINADDIAKSLANEIPDDRTRNIKAAEIAEQRRENAIQEKRSFAFETVMSTPEKVAILTQAKAKGYDVTLAFVTTDDPEKNVDRVTNRVIKGGHAVDPDTIHRRYHSAMALLPCAVEHADIALIVDNSNDTPIRVARKDGQLFTVAENPPQWVADRLVKPYQDREQSRAQINQAYAGQAVSTSLPAIIQEADASHGKTYRGKVIEATQHHILQQTGANQFVVHDRSLSPQQDLHKGRQATIGYAYDKGKIIALAPEKAVGKGVPEHETMRRETIAAAAPRNDLNKNQAAMHADASNFLATNMQALHKQPSMANRSVEDLTKLAYWRGIVAGENKLQPKAEQDEALARFDKQAVDPQFLKRLNQEAEPKIQDKTTERVQRHDPQEPSL